MIILLLLLDVLIYRFTSFHTYFIALAPVIYDKEDIWKLILTGIILDYFFFHQYPIETIILLFIFFIVLVLKKKIILPKWNYFICTFVAFLLFLLCNSMIYGKYFLLFRQKSIFIAMILQLCMAYISDRKGVTHIKWIR